MAGRIARKRIISARGENENQKEKEFLLSTKKLNELPPILFSVGKCFEKEDPEKLLAGTC